MTLSTGAAGPCSARWRSSLERGCCLRECAVRYLHLNFSSLAGRACTVSSRYEDGSVKYPFLDCLAYVHPLEVRAGMALDSSRQTVGPVIMDVQLVYETARKAFPANQGGGLDLLGFEMPGSKIKLASVTVIHILFPLVGH